MIITASTDSLQLTPEWNRPDPRLIQELGSFPTALIGDAQARIGLMHSAIRSVTPGLKMAGTVLPIHTREGDNLAIHRALDDAQRGDVLVINANSETNRACFGGILGELCIARGIAGVVIDGATRDVDELLALDLPTFARGISPAGPFKYGPGAIGTPVACGNVVCNPGDAIMGDGDGIVVVPQHLITTAIENTRKQQATEEGIRARIPVLT
ncbi:RraA family protein [Arthrobacter sp. Marseille-P9274]|uniref:RraA family protein n=1 Tax=Arthrobacter sp. Marseille-P9274 TaxID=2866572 RepID=UPI0021C74837|nr:RraA family protein [Arthrobacter sp. Marseille-P9274]